MKTDTVTPHFYPTKSLEIPNLNLVCCFVRAVDFPKRAIQRETDAENALASREDRSRTPVSRAYQVHLPSKTTGSDSENLDERLVTYFQSADEETSQQQLEYLLDRVAKPIIHRIVQRSERLSVSSGRESSVQDIVAETLLRLLGRLHTLKANPQRQLISNFDGLVATVTYRSIADHLRTRNRQRTNLEKKIRRLFAANNDLGIWKDTQSETVSGYIAWRTDEKQSGASRYPSPAELSAALAEARFKSRKTNTAELILLLLNNVHGPIRFKDLIEAISEIVFAQPLNWHEVNDPFTQFDQAVDIDENRRLVERLFAEIQKLGIEQRKSLLLNMTDSYGYSIEWFAFTGIATEAQLAELLQVSVDEFRRLLNDLPMTDKKIAKELGISPTKVANIRKAVRDRLARCRRAFLKEEGR